MFFLIIAFIRFYSRLNDFKAVSFANLKTFLAVFLPRKKFFNFFYKEQKLLFLRHLNKPKSLPVYSDRLFRKQNYTSTVQYICNEKIF